MSDYKTNQQIADEQVRDIGPRSIMLFGKMYTLDLIATCRPEFIADLRRRLKVFLDERDREAHPALVDPKDTK